MTAFTAWSIKRKMVAQKCIPLINPNMTTSLVIEPRVVTQWGFVPSVTIVGNGVPFAMTGLLH